MAQLAIVVYGTAAALYTLAALSHILYMFRTDFDAIARWSTRGAWGVQTVGLALIIVVTGRAPVSSLFEFAYFFTWVLMTNYIIMEMIQRRQDAGSFLTPVCAAVLTLSMVLAKPLPERWVNDEFPISLVVWHVAVTLLGYAFFTAASVSGALYLIQERNLRRKHWGPLSRRLPSLEALDVWGGRFVYMGFPLLTLGMGAGMVFAHVTWLTFWQSDPKVVFTAFVWLIYAGYLLMRYVWGWGGRMAAWWSVVGAATLLVNYFVMNLISKLHRFGI